MHLIILQLSGREKFANGFRHYKLNSHTLVNSVEDGKIYFDKLKASKTIQYSFVSCEELTDSEFKTLKNSHPKNMKLYDFHGIKVSHVCDELLSTRNELF